MSDYELATPSTEYSQLIDSIGNTLNEARNNLAQAVNSVMVDAYWQVGQQIVEFEQKGSARRKRQSRIRRKPVASAIQRFDAAIWQGLQSLKSDLYA